MTLRSDISNSQILGLNFLGAVVMLLWQQVNMKTITSLQKISSFYLCCFHLLFAPCVRLNQDTDFSASQQKSKKDV